MARRKGRRNGGKKVEQLRSRNFSIKRVVSKSESESKSAPILSMVSGKKIIAMQTSNDCIQQQENIFSTGKRKRPCDEFGDSVQQGEMESGNQSYNQDSNDYHAINDKSPNDDLRKTKISNNFHFDIIGGCSFTTMDDLIKNCDNGPKHDGRNVVQAQIKAVQSIEGRVFNDHGDIMSTVVLDEDESGQIYPCGLTGLCNLGNTCYFNASVQALSNCLPLSDFFLSHQSLAPFASLAAQRGKEPPMARSFRLLLQAIWSPRRNGYTNPQQLLMQIRLFYPQFRGWMQQDAQEFIRYFLDTLHQELKQPVYPWEIRDRSNPLLSHEAFHLDSSLLRSHSKIFTYSKGKTSYSRRDSSTSSSNSYNSVETRYETADSGWSSEGDNSSKYKKNRSIEALDTRSSEIPSDPFSSASNFMERPIRYRSIISDVFDGQLCSTVKCLTCHHLSETNEIFQDLSLSIPTKDQLNHTVAHSSFVKDDATEYKNEKEFTSTSALSYMSIGLQWILWLTSFWLYILYNYLFETPVSLFDALNAFFTPDNLRGDNMYSCENCSKLRDGIKVCRITRLPEILCIHLKRFRHDSSYSSKISTGVTFPLNDLDLSSFMSKSASISDHYAIFDLCAFITHRGGGIESGHYVAYCKNQYDECWYEFDDSVVTKVEAADVATKEAYVLFYQKRQRPFMNHIKNQMKRLVEMEKTGTYKSFKISSNYYISREWLHRLSTFSYPGPITNHDFLCQHSQILPHRAANLTSYCAYVNEDVWIYLSEKFGGGPACSELHYCIPCQKSYLHLRCKRENELKMVKEIKRRVRMTSRSFPHLTYDYYLPPNAISKAWMDKWRDFIKSESIDPPPAIDNSLMLYSDSKSSTIRFRSNSQHLRISRELWLFFVQTYGGGPEVFCVQNVHPSKEEVEQLVNAVDFKIAEAMRSISLRKHTVGADELKLDFLVKNEMELHDVSLKLPDGLSGASDRDLSNCEVR